MIMVEEQAFKWDWKETPPIKSIIKSAIEIHKEYGNVEIYEINTHSDEDGLLLSPNKYNDDDAKIVWEIIYYKD